MNNPSEIDEVEEKKKLFKMGEVIYKNYDINNDIIPLLRDEPFFSFISAYLKKVKTTSIPTAGVRFNKKTLTFELAYNPIFMGSLKFNQRQAVIKHEYYHIALGHCTDRKPESENGFLWNIAADLAINSLPSMPENLPSFACIPGKKGSEFENLPPQMSAEWYMKNMPEEIKNACKAGNGQKTLDDHSDWSDGEYDSEGKSKIDEAHKEIAKQRLREVVRKAYQDAQIKYAKGDRRAWGSISAEIMEEIKKTFSHKLSPEKVLKHFVKSSIKSSRKHSITKINKRWPYIHPGRCYDRRAKVAISIDQSGSVDDSMLEMFFGWLISLAAIADFIVIPFDSEVFEDKVYEWKKGEKRKVERVLAGGTDFNAPTRYVNERGFDGHIILTDMCAPKPIQSRCQRMWITTKACKQNLFFETHEKVLAID